MNKQFVFGVAFVVVFVAVIGSLAFATVATTHVVFDHQTTTQLFWNENRAYLVVGMRRDGWSGSQAEYLWQIIAGVFYRAFQFKESRTWLVMTNIEPNRVNRVVLDGERFRAMRPFGEAIYIPFGSVQKWNGQRFELVSDAEAERVKASKFSSDPVFDDVDGWSGRINLLNQGNSRFDYALDLNQRKVVVIADRTDQRHPTLTVRRGETETIEVISVNERFRTVSAEEYDVLMHKLLKH